ncbi:MAG: suppressor of fused domain protein [Actinomycetota bacterium]
MPESVILIEESNPYGSLEALVEDDGRTIYLYLRHLENEEWPLKPLWVLNRAPAPEAEDIEAMKAGQAPLMRRAGTRHPEGAAALDPSRLRLLWLPSGDGVALLEGDEPLAILPPWSDNRMPGYSREAVGEQLLAWALDESAMKGMRPRLHEAEEFWAWRSQDDCWDKLQTETLDHLERRLGRHVRYWSADNNEYPPRGVALFQPEQHPGVFVYATVGMSGQPLPQVEMYTREPWKHQFLELAIATEGECEWAPGVLSALMAHPWKDVTWYGDGHSFGWESVRWRNGGPFNMLFSASPPPDARDAAQRGKSSPAPNLSGLTSWKGAPVIFLWVLPVSVADRELAIEEGSQALLRRLEAARRGWVHHEN